MFFAAQVGTEQQSLMLTKRLVAASVSSIFFHREMFEENEFGVRYHNGSKVYLLTNENASPGVLSVLGNLTCCFKAIEKKYLKQMVIAFVEDQANPDDFIEAYAFKFTYPSNDTMMEVEW